MMTNNSGLAGLGDWLSHVSRLPLALTWLSAHTDCVPQPVVRLCWLVPPPPRCAAVRPWRPAVPLWGVVQRVQGNCLVRAAKSRPPTLFGCGCLVLAARLCLRVVVCCWFVSVARGATATIGSRRKALLALCCMIVGCFCRARHSSSNNNNSNKWFPAQSVACALWFDGCVFLLCVALQQQSVPGAKRCLRVVV